jgi:prophage tail gpP-like protein
MHDDGDLTIKINNHTISGWTSVRVNAGLESCPRSFDIGMTERYPGEIAGVIMRPGDPCDVLIGRDLVVTGYVDRYLPRISKDAHSVQLVGRGMCEDLVDCSAQWPSTQISNGTALWIAKKLAAVYGVSVVGIGDIDSDPIPQFNFIWGETPYDIIERIARYKALLVYEDAWGELVLATIGSEQHASGFVLGQNVQDAAARFTTDQRFSQYIVRTLQQSFADLTSATSDIIEYIGDDAMAALKRKDGTPRDRTLMIVAETGDYYGFPLALKRGKWECARRAGRSQCVTVVADSWRDSAGRLWEPNRLALLDLPALKIHKLLWVISDVTFIRDEGGTRAVVTLMPPDAFIPAPLLLQPYLPDVVPIKRGQDQP